MGTVRASSHVDRGRRQPAVDGTESTTMAQRERAIQDLSGDWTRYRFAPPVHSDRRRRRRNRRATAPVATPKRTARTR
jgi:hypothetical protein